MPFTPEQIIDALYGPPPKEGQKKLEDFKKKNIPKPEKLKGERIITAENKEGKEIIFNLEEIKEYWREWYKNHNLKEFSETIEDLEINLTEDQIERIKEKSKEGFDKFILLPSPELQNQYLANLKTETEKELTGLDDKNQYSQEGTRLSDSVQPNFPNNLKVLNRPAKPYLLFLKNTKEPDQDTLDKTADWLRETFSQRNETGLILPEYLIFQRDYTEVNKNHPDHQYSTWLLDEESPQKGGSAHVLGSSWGPGGRRVGVGSYPPDDSYSFRGGRSSAIFEI